MVTNKEVAKKIIEILQGDDISKKTKSKLRKEISQDLSVGQVIADDILSKLEGFGVIYIQKVGRAYVYCVNKNNLGEIEKIKDK